MNQRYAWLSILNDKSKVIDSVVYYVNEIKIRKKITKEAFTQMKDQN
jgi:hypothetical protein